MKLTKNFYVLAALILLLGVAVYVWRLKVSHFEIDYTKTTFEDEKSIADCSASALKSSQSMGKTKAEPKHFDFYCRCTQYNTPDKNDIKDTIAVQKNCWVWTEEFFQQPGLFDK